MVSKKVMRFPSKVAVQGYQSLCFGKVPMSAKAYLNSLGAEGIYICLPRISLPRGRHIYMHAMSGAQALDIPVCFS